MPEYLTSGQTARKLRVSVSTLKRWLDDPELGIEDMRNECGWRLISRYQLGVLKEHKRRLRKNGKRFKRDTTLMPVVTRSKTA